jgi:hypothetical protein
MEIMYAGTDMSIKPSVYVKYSKTEEIFKKFLGLRHFIQFNFFGFRRTIVLSVTPEANSRCGDCGGHLKSL